MNYLLDKQTIFKNKDRKKKLPHFWLGIVLIFVLYLGGPFLLKVLSVPVIFVVKPIFEASEASQGVIFKTVDFFRFQRSLVLENKDLINENRILAVKVTSYESKLKDLTDLEKIVGRYEEPANIFVAKVFDRPPYLSFDTFLVDLGRKHSATLKAGAKVFVEREILLGEVVQVFTNSTKVKLYSSPGVKIGAVIGENNIRTNIEGMGGGNFLALLPRTLEVKTGDKVFTIDQNPKLIGVVGAVDNDTRNPTQKIYISSPVNIYELNWVEIQK